MAERVEEILACFGWYKACYFQLILPKLKSLRARERRSRWRVVSGSQTLFVKKGKLLFRHWGSWALSRRDKDSGHRTARAKQRATVGQSRHGHGWP